MSGFRDYARGVQAGFSEGVGDVSRDAVAGAGDAYQEFLTADAGIGPPDGLTGDMVHTGPAIEVTQSYQLALLEHGAAAGKEAEAAHWRDYEADNPEPPDTGAEIEEPDISAPEIDVE